MLLVSEGTKYDQIFTGEHPYCPSQVLMAISGQYDDSTEGRLEYDKNISQYGVE